MRTNQGLTRVAGVVGVVMGASLTPGVAGASATQSSHSPRYELIDVGTFGGAHAELNGPAANITARGAILGSADTPVPDRSYPSNNPFLFPDAQIMHAFAWYAGRLHDLGALPGNNSSAVFEINRRGVGIGFSETGRRDRRNGYPAAHAVLFDHGRVVDLGTLPGGTSSIGLDINDRGQVAGFANNGVPDAHSMLPWNTQTRSFIWQDGTMRDLGTLGGPDASTASMNEHGQIVGNSNTEATGTVVHPFLWSDGHMRDLGSFGGTQSDTRWINNAGEVVGLSTLAGDETAHPFLWDGRRLRDLGTLGGTFGAARYINDAGTVVGFASPASDDTVHAFIWKHGRMRDLTSSAVQQCAVAEVGNLADVVVGETCDNSAALVWLDGQQYDLNALTGRPDVHLTEAAYVDERGQIATIGTLPSGDQHVFLLRPVIS